MFNLEEKRDLVSQGIVHLFSFQEYRLVNGRHLDTLMSSAKTPSASAYSNTFAWIIISDAMQHGTNAGL